MKIILSYKEAIISWIYQSYLSG